MNRSPTNQLSRTAGGDLNSYFCGSYADVLQVQAPNAKDRYQSKARAAEVSSTAGAKLNLFTGESYAEALQCEYLEEEVRNGTVPEAAHQLPTAEGGLKYPACWAFDDRKGEIQKQPIAVQAHESSTSNANSNLIGSGGYAEILQGGSRNDVERSFTSNKTSEESIMTISNKKTFSKEKKSEILQERRQYSAFTPENVPHIHSLGGAGVQRIIQSLHIHNNTIPTLDRDNTEDLAKLKRNRSSTANANSNLMGSWGYAEILRGGSRSDEEERSPTSSKTSEQSIMTVSNEKSFSYGKNAESLQERRQYSAFTPDNVPQTDSLGGAGVQRITQSLHMHKNTIPRVDRDDTEALSKLKRKEYVLRALAHVGKTLRPHPLKAYECKLGKTSSLSSCFSSRGDDSGAADIATSNGTGTEKKKLRRIEFALSVLNNPNKCETDRLIQRGVAEALQRRKQAMLSSLESGCGTAVAGASNPVQPPAFNLNVPITYLSRRRGVDNKVFLNDVPSVPSFIRNPHLLSGKCIDHRLYPTRGENQQQCFKDRRQEPKSMTEKMNFPQKLMNILSRKDTQHAITWLPEGDAFSIIDGEAFVSEVAPIFFKRDKKIDSFLRRLSRWGFEKVSYVHSTRAPLNEMVYWHKHFLRAEPELCSQIKTRYGSRGKGMSLITGDAIRDNKDEPIPSLEPDETTSCFQICTSDVPLT